jgi:hypothetical protein
MYVTMYTDLSGHEIIHVTLRAWCYNTTSSRIETCLISKVQTLLSLVAKNLIQGLCQSQTRHS